MGIEKSDQEKKARTMHLMSAEDATLAELIGGPEDVSYLQFQTAMLKQDRERRLYGITRDQALADNTSSTFQVAQHLDASVKQLAEGAFTVMPRQAWRGSGFGPTRGRNGQRNQGKNNEVRQQQQRHHNNQQGNSDYRHGNRSGRGQNMWGNNNSSGRHGGDQRANNRPVICFTCGGTGHVSAQCPSFCGNNGRANTHINMEHGDNTRQSNPNYSVQDLTYDLSYSFCFMMSAQSTINFPLGTGEHWCLSTPIAQDT